jgi:hypothetical protein
MRGRRRRTRGRRRQTRGRRRRTQARVGWSPGSLIREGGNRWTAYNWENNASNAGSDWCYQDDGYLSDSNVPGEAVRASVELAQQLGGATLLTVPIVDYVAADKLEGCDVRKTPNYLTTRMRQNRATKGSAWSLTPDGSDAFVYQDEFVNWTRARFPAANIHFSLDNEPDLWAYTHPEVHPNPVGYDELVQRNITSATAIKTAAPNAKVFGFVSYGFNGYINLQDAPDAAGKGEFIDYYLQKMRAAETTAGRRLVDYLDLHWYPEATGGNVRITGPETGATVVEARVQAPRSLWDETYVESSWIVDYLGGQPIRLLPGLKERISRLYPGTLLAFTEWNYGGGGHISGAIATADVLGVFGREGVGASTLWELNTNETFTRAAFGVYRNYDGAGGRFGDRSIRAITSDRAAASVYASVDSANPSRVVVVAINKRSTTQIVGITVAHSRQVTAADVYTLTSAASRPVAAAPISSVATNAFRYTMPAYSISILIPR